MDINKQKSAIYPLFATPVMVCGEEYKVNDSGQTGELIDYNQKAINQHLNSIMNLSCINLERIKNKRELKF